MKYGVVIAALLALTPLAHAQVEVKAAWARPAVAGQSATGAFMTITATKDARLVGAASPAAGLVEIHEMKMDGTVMKMRAITALDLPAGRAVELKPGGYHVMLMELKQPLKAGDKIRLELRVELSDRSMVTLPVDFEVAMRGPQAGSGAHKH